MKLLNLGLIMMVAVVALGCAGCEQEPDVSKLIEKEVEITKVVE